MTDKALQHTLKKTIWPNGNNMTMIYITLCLDPAWVLKTLLEQQWITI